MATNLQRAARIRNWKLAQLKMAMATLRGLNAFILNEQHRLSNKGRLRSMEKEIEQAIKDSYEEYKKNELRARATSSTQAGQGEVTGKERVYTKLPF